MKKLEYIKEHLDKPIVIIGMMGAGKTKLGRFLSTLIEWPFFDSDYEIEYAAQMTIPDIFEEFGEEYFRDGERRVIKRLLENEKSIISTGGGAILNEDTRNEIKKKAISIWIKADPEILYERIIKNNNRPLLKVDNPKAKIKEILEIREALYSQADITIISERGAIEQLEEQIIDNLYKFIGNNNG